MTSKLHHEASLGFVFEVDLNTKLLFEYLDQFLQHLSVGLRPVCLIRMMSPMNIMESILLPLLSSVISIQETSASGLLFGRS